MSKSDTSKTYRRLIDELVEECRDGQGSIGSKRVRAGLWNANATAKTIPDQHAINLLLARLPAADRKIIANMLSQQFVNGVHTALRVLYDAKVEPFDKSYEGAPFNDFVGRLDDWPWPTRDRDA